MNVAPILIMASAVFVFAVTALSIATILGVGISQVRNFMQKRSRA
ncbi:MAG: hypothetical protein ABW080_09310 [Candidatus Thiodiazotropha sp.]